MSDWLTPETRVFKHLRMMAEDRALPSAVLNGVLTTEQVLGQLVSRLETYVLSDHVLHETQPVYFTTPVKVEVEVIDRWWQWGIIPRSHKRKELVTTTATGTVQVRADYYRTFPDCDMSYYPKALGEPFRVVTLHQDFNGR